MTRRYSRLIRRAISVVLICAGAVIVALSTPVGASVLFTSLQIYPPIEPRHLSQLAIGSPAAIVILSGGRRNYAPEYGQVATGTVDALTLERLRYGAFLARQMNLPILVSGGLDPIPLAVLMKQTLANDYGITARWVEANSRNTAENAMFSSRMLKHAGILRIILVTHAWHMKRAVAAFTANGMAVIPAPTAFYVPAPRSFLAAITPSLGTLRMSGYAIHELVGGIWYAVRYGY